MIADDHPSFRDGLCRLLQDEPDLEIVATPGEGKEAVELAGKLKPNIIVMDISMPEMNGLDAAKQIKATTPEIAILMVSAYGYQSYVLAALRAGAAGYLLKNAPLHEIIKAIRMVSSGDAVFDMKITGALLQKMAGDKIEKHTDIEELHTREQQVLSLAAKGMGNKEIATNLGISERTVQTHLVNIFKKLKVGSRTEAVLRALKEGWLTLNDLPDNQN
jgi:two-component system, NarL family, response regulator LiaR